MSDLDDRRRQLHAQARQALIAMRTRLAGGVLPPPNWIDLDWVGWTRMHPGAAEVLAAWLAGRLTGDPGTVTVLLSCEAENYPVPEPVTLHRIRAHRPGGQLMSVAITIAGQIILTGPLTVTVTED